MATIAGIATGDPRFSLLVDTLQFIDANLPGSTLVATLSDPGQSLTVFAPTNAAFAQLAADLGYGGDPADTAAIASFLTTNVPVATLNDVILYHVSGGVQDAAAITAAGTVSTLQGGAIDASGLPALGDLEPDLIDPSLIATDVAADNGIVHVIDRVLLPVDLAGNDAPSVTGLVLAESGASGFDTNGADFDILREALGAANLADTLNGPGDFTVFAPTDAAFVSLSQGLGYSGSDEEGALTYLLDSLRLLNGGNDPVELLTTVLQYHVAGESLQASQIVAAGGVTTLQGGAITLDGTQLVDADPDIANPSLAATDLQASNGIVHVIDGVLLPVDVLQSDGSNDVDFVIADDDANVIDTGRDNDLIDAKGGDDAIHASKGDDLVLAGAGDDFVSAGKGADTVKGEAGDDIIFGNGGRDQIHGGDGADKLFGNFGNDTIDGGDGNDAIFGGFGRDNLMGGAGDDFISGGPGNDTLVGGAGNDDLVGGFGKDTFVFEKNGGHDTVYDFIVGHDKIDVSALGISGFDEIENSLSTSFFEADIDLGDTQVTVLGLNLNALDADDFIYA